MVLYKERVMSKNKENLEIMRKIVEAKKAKSSTQRGLDNKADKTMGEKRKKIYVKKTGGLFDK